MNIFALTIIFVTGVMGIILLSTTHSPTETLDEKLKAFPKISSLKELYPFFCSATGITVATLTMQTRALGAALLLGGGSGYLFSQITKQAFQRSAEKRRNRSLDFAIASVLEQVHLKVMNGNSLKAALTAAEDPGNRDVRYLLNMLKSGLDLPQAGTFWINDFDNPTKRRVVDILTSNATAAETLALVEALIEHLRNEQKFALIGEIERRNQLVWIPVTLAVLLPGMIFIAIPLEATLKALLG